METTRTSPRSALRDPGTPDRRERLRRDRELFEHYRDSGSPVDREIVVRRFLPLARQLAAGYAHGSEPFDDLFQVACLGLVRAVDRFDTERRIAFSSYAVPTIRGELKRYFRDKTWALRMPRDLQELGLQVERTTERLTASLGRSPTIGEIANAIGAEREEVLEARDAMSAYNATSLELARSAEEGDETALVDVLGCADGGYRRAEERVFLDDLLGCLTVRARHVVRLRFEQDLTQREIGERVGISQMQVSRILRGSIARLREVLCDDGAGDARRAA